jgi:hypothetical protein
MNKDLEQTVAELEKRVSELEQVYIVESSEQNNETNWFWIFAIVAMVVLGLSVLTDHR